MGRQSSGRVEEILASMDQVAPYFYRVYEEGRRNSDYYMGLQWTDSELAMFRREGREPYVWNKIYTYINNILGMQIQTRTDFTVTPVEPADSEISQIMLYLLKWASAVNDLDTIETSVFLHGLLNGFSCTQVRWELSDFWGGYPKIERVPSYQMMWDATDTSADISQARWVARVIPMVADEIDESFPSSMAKKIKSSYSDLRFNKLPFYSYLSANQQLIYYMTGGGYNDKDKYPYFVVEFYERRRKPIYIVVDLIMGNGMEFDSEKSAEEYLAGLLSEYSSIEGIQLTDDNGGDLVYISEGKRDRIVQSIVCGGVLIEERETDLTDFPFQFFFPSNVDGMIYSPVSTLVPPQKFLNKLISEWDNILGRTGRGVLTVVESLLPRGWTADRIAKLRSQTAPVIPILREGAINMLPDHKVTPDIPQLISTISQFMLEAGGGPNILGLQENAAESGRSVRARQAAAGMGRVPFFNALLLWKKKLSNYLIWIMQNYMEQKQVERVIGSQMNTNFTGLNSDQFDTLKAIKVDVNLTIAVNTESAREEMFNQIQQMISSGLSSALSPQTLLYLLLELNPGISKDIKETVYNMEPVIKEALGKLQQQARQQEIQTQAQEGAERAMIRKQIMEQNDAGQQQQPPI